jgi:hypothetical protein
MAARTPTTPGVTCLQLNLHHCIAASVNLARVVDLANPGVVFLQEPWTRKGKIQNVPYGFDCFSDPQNPRAAVFVTAQLKAWHRPDLSDRDLCVIQTDHILHGRTTILASIIYIPGDGPAVPQNLITLVEYCSERKFELVVAGVINAHHTHWGSNISNDRGDDLLAYVCSTNLEFCNIGGTPTFDNGRWTEFLDVTLASHRLASMVENWEVWDAEESLSDHRFVRFQLRTTRQRPGILWKRNVRNTNWTAFAETLQHQLNQLAPNAPTTCQETDDLADSLSKCISVAHEASCPLKAYKGKKSAPW